MDESMKIYWKIYFEKYSNDKIIRQSLNPIREYENELIEGPVIDIGCGQSPFLLEFSTSKREIIAVDNEQTQLDYLKERVLKQKHSNLKNWRFCLLEFPKEKIPERVYSLIIFSDFFHFFTLSECVSIAAEIEKLTTRGTLIFVRVHSTKFYKNDPKDPNNNEYFKHYFTTQELENVFNKKSFERIYSAEIEKVDSKEERTIASQWLDQCHKLNGITDPKINEELKNEYLANKTQAYIIAMFRKM